MKRKVSVFCMLLLAGMSVGLLAGCMSGDDVGESYRTFEGQMISDYVEENENLSLFAEAMKRAGAFSLLQSYGKYTAFVPSNDAMRRYLEKKGATIDSMTDEEVQELVFYHIIDGVEKGIEACPSYEFPTGAFSVQNMSGRYLSATVVTGTGAYALRNGEENAVVISPDNNMTNGIVHVVDMVLEGCYDLVADFVASKPRYSIFGEAMMLTGWRDSMLVMQDDGYVMPTEDLPRGEGKPRSSSTQYYTWPKARKFLYTCFAESDSIMRLREGITSIDDLKAFALRVYGDEGHEDDYTHERNSLHRFIGYHLLPVQRSHTKLVVNYGYVHAYDWFSQNNTEWRDYVIDDDYRVDNFFFPMQPGTIMNIQNGNTVAFDRSSESTIPLINVPVSAFNSAYPSLSTMDEVNGMPVIGLVKDEVDQYCGNGVLHGIDNMLVFDDKVLSMIRSNRMRFDIRTFMGEGVNNEIFYDHDRGYNHYYTAAPNGFFKNFSMKTDNNTYWIYEGNVPHDYLLGDHISIYGNFDCVLNIGPLPEGNYEVRVGYVSGLSNTDSYSGQTGAVFQAYVDGVPCGIPVDTRVSAYQGETGWIQDYAAIEACDEDAGKIYFKGRGESEDDPYGYENDKNLRNHGFMKAPNCFVGTNYYNTNGYGSTWTARNVDTRQRKILGSFNFSAGMHTVRFVAMKSGRFDLDYIELMPVANIDTENQH